MSWQRRALLHCRGERQASRSGVTPAHRQRCEKPRLEQTTYNTTARRKQPRTHIDAAVRTSHGQLTSSRSSLSDTVRMPMPSAQSHTQSHAHTTQCSTSSSHAPLLWAHSTAQSLAASLHIPHSTPPRIQSDTRQQRYIDGPARRAHCTPRDSTLQHRTSTPHSRRWHSVHDSNARCSRVNARVIASLQQSCAQLSRMSATTNDDVTRDSDAKQSNREHNRTWHDSTPQRHDTWTSRHGRHEIHRHTLRSQEALPTRQTLPPAPSRHSNSNRNSNGDIGWRITRHRAATHTNGGQTPARTGASSLQRHFIAVTILCTTTMPSQPHLALAADATVTGRACVARAGGRRTTQQRGSHRRGKSTASRRCGCARAE
jgi:hypothetical protein